MSFSADRRERMRQNNLLIKARESDGPSAGKIMELGGWGGQNFFTEEGGEL